MSKVSRKQKKQLRLTILLLIALIYISALTFGSHGLINWYELKQVNNDLDEQLENDSLRYKQMQKEQKALKDNPKHIEKVAREKYNMQKKDEKVYKINKTDAKKSQE
jgi:cell division protein DivIC